jgi:hypothetical protein
MKKTIIVIVCVIGLLRLQTIHAQGVLYVSNLGQSVAGSGAIGSNSWVAQTFITGTNAGGYLLSSVELLMDAPAGTPSGFTVSIYSKTGDPHSEHEPGDSPQSSLGSLTGSEPTTAGTLSYTNSGILLSPSTFYFVVVTAATSTNVGAYTWSATSGTTQGSNRFTVDDEFFGSSDGSDWTWYVRGRVFQFGLYASAVQPPNLSIISDGLGGINIQWPNIGSYILEQSTNLACTNWAASSYTITNNVLTNFCTVSPASEGLFFRLKQQLP